MKRRIIWTINGNVPNLVGYVWKQWFGAFEEKYVSDDFQNFFRKIGNIHQSCLQTCPNKLQKSFIFC